MTTEILRYTAFPAAGQGGNPAGVVLDAHGMTDAEMLAAAADVGFSETRAGGWCRCGPAPSAVSWSPP